MDAGATMQGGIVLDKHNNPYLSNSINVTGIAVERTKLRVVANVTGPSAVEISGNAVVT
jgi:hypothetical protein